MSWSARKWPPIYSLIQMSPLQPWVSAGFQTFYKAFCIRFGFVCLEPAHQMFSLIENIIAVHVYWKKRDVQTLTPPDFYKTFHSSSLNQVLIWPGFNVCFKLMHHNEKSWQDYLGISFSDLAELHCFHNYNEDT